MLATAITIFGLEIPAAGPVFSVALIAHVLAGLTCVVTGALAASAPKRAGHHPRSGTIYYRGLAVVIGTVAFTAGTVGYLARRRRWRGWLTAYVVGMGVSYVAMLTAFYVDNGPQLPLWNRLPGLAFWVGPSLIGVPLIMRALARYRPKARGRAPTMPAA